MNFGSYSTLSFLNQHIWIFILFVKVNKKYKRSREEEDKEVGGGKREGGREGTLWSSHLKEEAECILLLTCEMDRQALNEDPLRVFHDGHWCDWGSNVGQSGQEIKQVLIIDLQVGNTYSDGMCGALLNHPENLDGNLSTVTKSRAPTALTSAPRKASGESIRECGTILVLKRFIVWLIDDEHDQQLLLLGKIIHSWVLLFWFPHSVPGYLEFKM